MNKDSADRTYFSSTKQKCGGEFSVFEVCALCWSKKGRSAEIYYQGDHFRHEIASVAKGAINVSKIATVNFTSHSTVKKTCSNKWMAK